MITRAFDVNEKDYDKFKELIDEDIEVLTSNSIYPSLINFKDELQNIIKKSNDNKIINEGINIAIIGKPNVGKSSLLNNLLNEEKAIVTDIEGTTRDIVEGKILLNGILLNIIDGTQRTGLTFSIVLNMLMLMWLDLMCLV